MNNQIEVRSINTIKDEGIVNYFSANIGRRVFILTEAFPFMFIGTLKAMNNDMAVLYVETTSVPALEGKEWSVHIHSIDVFYIEPDIGPKIPELKD